jgi:hypothetical protein
MGDLYFCPTAGEIESVAHGGFDQCCYRPDKHLPMPDGPGTVAVARALSKALRREHALGQKVIRALVALEEDPPTHTAGSMKALSILKGEA